MGKHKDDCTCKHDHKHDHKHGECCGKHEHEHKHGDGECCCHGHEEGHVCQAPQRAEEFRALQRELWTRSYLLKITEFDGATVAPENAAPARGEAMAALAGGLTPDAVLTDAEEALAALGELTGASVREDVTARIFERFCVGK